MPSLGYPCPEWDVYGFDRYKDALVLLLREVLNRIQFRYNQAQLEELDDETLDDDVRTFNMVTTAVSCHQIPKTSVYILLFFAMG